jgi:hypothetical protein
MGMKKVARTSTDAGLLEEVRTGNVQVLVQLVLLVLVPVLTGTSTVPDLAVSQW